MSEGKKQVLGYQYTLVVGPDGDDRAQVEDTLRRGGMEVYATTLADLEAQLDVVPPRLVVLDDTRPRAERMAAFARLKEHAAVRGVPVMILAYDSDIDSFSEAISKGAAAYLVKPVSAEELAYTAHKLSGWLSSRDRTERRRRLRRPLLLKIDIDLKDRKARVRGQIVDVSSSGCRIELNEPVQKGDRASEPLQKGDRVRVILRGIEDSTHLALGAEVQWLKKTPEGYTAGLRFTGTTALLAAKVLGFVHTGMT